MKILIVIKKWKGGVGSYVSEIKKELENLGHGVKILSREDDLKVYSFYKSIIALNRAIKKIKKEWKFDILYTNDWSIEFPLVLSYPNHITCFHGIDPGSVQKIFQKIIAKIRGKKLIVVGDSLKKMFPNATLIYEGVDTDIFKPLPKIRKIKNSIGFANWKSENYNFSMIKNAAKKLKKKLIIAENIKREEMPKFYNKLETFISLPPDCTGFGLVWLEAMASGVPKIIGNNFGIGSKLPINKVENYISIEEAIEKATKKNYRKILSKQFTWEEHVYKLLLIFKK